MRHLGSEVARIFENEITVLSEIEEIQQVVEDTVYQKKWTDFESKQCRLNELSAQLETLEKRRLALFEENKAENANFYRWVESLEASESDYLKELYRILKNKTEKIKASGEAFTGYLREMQFVITGFLNAAFPERQTGVYSREGVVRNVDMRRMMLDKQF